jgi:hypothetical protein
VVEYELGCGLVLALSLAGHLRWSQMYDGKALQVGESHGIDVVWAPSQRSGPFVEVQRSSVENCFSVPVVSSSFGRRVVLSVVFVWVKRTEMLSLQKGVNL